jgi:hypothetical protein
MRVFGKNGRSTPSARANGIRFSGSGDANRPSQPAGSPGMMAE